MVRVGIIGMGMMGRTHYEAYDKLPNAKVTAICDIDPKRASGDLSGTGGNVVQGGLSQLPMNKIAGMRDYRELLARNDVDAVDICTPTPLHTEMVVAALAAAKHVISEKPLARTVEQGRHIAEAAAGATTFHMPAMCMRFWPQWAWLKGAIADRRYGNVRCASFRRQTSPLTRWFADGVQSGGAILDLHVHDIDFINYCFGPPRSVMSRGYKGYTGHIDHMITHYLYDDVPLVVAEGGWCMGEGFGFRMQYTVNFEHATADYDLARQEPLLLYRDGKQEPISCANETGYEAELRYFIDCIEKKQPPALVTAADGVTALRIVEAEKQSIDRGQIVRLV
jgi:predicted dehydrogenase